MSRLASVSSTIGRFSSIRSRAWEGKNPTYVSVFALISTYDAVLQSEAAITLRIRCKNPGRVLTKVTSNASWLDGKQKFLKYFVTS